MPIQKLIKVLMVFPLFPPSFWDFKKAMWFLKLKANMPPIGLATVAAMLPKDRFEVMPIIDLNVEPLTDEMLRSADIVMVSAMIVQKDSLFEVISRAKAFGKTVVVGGPYATAYREDVLAMGADHLVLNEAELTLAPFVEDFLAGKAERIYDEHSVISRVTVPLTKEGKPLLTTSPVPRFDLLKLSVYWSITLQYSRGCPFNCEFCNITALFGHQPRTKTVAQVIAELDALLATGWRGAIFFVDDNFIGDPDRLLELLWTLVAWQEKHHRPFSFSTEASINLADPKLRKVRKMMIRAGFDGVFIGLESPNPDVLTEMHKGQNKGDLGKKVRLLQRIGFEVTAGFIVGNDADTLTVFSDLDRHIRENAIVIAMVGLLGAPLGTAIYRRLKSEGRIRDETSGDNTHRFHFNFKPKLDEKFLVDGYADLLEQLFSPKNYYDRCRTLRRRRGKLWKDGPINGAWFQATLKVIYRNLVRKDWEFVRFMVGAIFTFSAKDIQQAVTHAIKFEHFREITQAAVSAHRSSKRVDALLD